MNKIILIFSALILSMASFAEVNRYMVFFADKSGFNYPYSIDRPSEFLTTKSIQRRFKQNITIDESDLPVNPKYVDSLKSLGIDVYFTSKWVNAALIQAEESEITRIESLGFVSEVNLVAKGKKLSRTKIEVEIPTEFNLPQIITSNTALQLSMLQINEMHQQGIKGQGILIAVLDNGFKGVNNLKPFEHLWTHDKIIGAKDFVENSGNVFRIDDHGTAVLSTIAGSYSPDFTGVVPDADFILCITEEKGAENRIEEYNWLFGAEYADSLGTDIINTSLGYLDFDLSEHDYGYEDLNGETAVVSIGAKMASGKGILVVVSAGNEGDQPETGWRYVTPPADAPNILTVGSVNPDFSWTPFSSMGPTYDGRIKPDVCALGLRTSLIKGGGSINKGNGTSFAAPQITGLAAGLWQVNPAWTNLEVIDSIKRAGHKANDPDTLVGYGVPLFIFSKQEKRILNVSDILSDKAKIYPNPFQDGKFNLEVGEDVLGPIGLQLTNSDGLIILSDYIESMGSKKVIEFFLDDIKAGHYFLSLQYENREKVVQLTNFK